MLLEIEQLAHEVEVGRDVALAQLDEVVGVVEGPPARVHEVGHGQGHRPADAGKTVDQDAVASAAGFVC